MMGASTCSSNPVDMRGTKLVLPSGRRSGAKVNCWVPVQAKLTTPGHPKLVALSELTCEAVLLSCEVLAAKLNPVSTKAAMPTGPTMGMRYSMLLTMLVSPPGALMLLMGSATNTLPGRGFEG